MSRVGSISWFFLLAAIATAALVLPSGAPADDAVYFAYDFGDGYNQRYEISFSEERAAGNYSMTSIFDLEITEKFIGVNDDGKFEIEIVFDKVDASVMLFDQMRETHIGEQLTGQSIGFLLDKNGEHSELKALGYIESWEQHKGTIEMFVGMFYVPLPGKGYAKDDKWEYTDEQDNNGLNTTTRSEYHFKEMKKEAGHDCAKVTIETEVGLGGILETPGGDFETEGEGEGESEFYFDSANGLVVKLKSKIEVNLDLTPVTGKGEVQQVTNTYEIERKLL
jgi:hypothetical protein